VLHVPDTIIYNGCLTLEGIPPEAWDYVVNGKPALAWIMERYQIKPDPDSGIVNDPNLWCQEHDNPRYVVDLVKRVTRVSVESVRLIAQLPALNEIPDVLGV
jgi:predicted helicase